MFSLKQFATTHYQKQLATASARIKIRTLSIGVNISKVYTMYIWIQYRAQFPGWSHNHYLDFEEAVINAVTSSFGEEDMKLFCGLLDGLNFLPVGDVP